MQILRMVWFRCSVCFGALMLFIACAGPKTTLPTTQPSAVTPMLPQPAPGGVGMPGNSVGQATPLSPPTEAPKAHPPLLTPGLGPDILAFLGTGWELAASGDIDADPTTLEIIAYKSSTIVPQSSLTGPAYARYLLVASDVTIVQERSSGVPQLMLLVTPQEITSTGRLLRRFDPNSSAFMVAALPQPNVAFEVIPLDTIGAPVGRTVAVQWDPAQKSYQLMESE
jgi:hypothetical protein